MEIKFETYDGNIERARIYDYWVYKVHNRYFTNIKEALKEALQ